MTPAGTRARELVATVAKALGTPQRLRRIAGLDERPSDAVDDEPTFELTAAGLAAVAAGPRKRAGG